MKAQKDIQLELSENQYLECSRILLRPVRLHDAADMHEYASNEENTRYVFERHESLEQTKQNIALFFLTQPLGKFAIEHCQSKKMIGTIDLRVSEQQKRGELGYILNQKFWGNGYMTEAAQAVLALAFEKLALQKVFSMHDIENPASGQVMLRLGMQKEGILRKHEMHKGKRVDMAYYGILREEYFQSKED